MIVLIESPYAGDIQRNSEYARRAMLYVIEQGRTPIVPHLLYPQVLDDSDPMQRERALEMCAELRESVNQVWFFTDYGWSDGMLRAEHEMEFFSTHRKHVVIGENPDGPCYRKLPVEQQLELERHDRKGAHAQLRVTEAKLNFEREKVKRLLRPTAEAIERANAILHPNGRCTCWGEGWCELCKKWEAEDVWNGCFAGGTRPDTDRTVVVRLKNEEQFGAFYRNGVWYYLNGDALLLQAEVEAWREPFGSES